MGNSYKIVILLLFVDCVYVISNINSELTQIWGPGLEPEKIVMPARYFFIKLGKSENNNR